jgi:hypothetical protein
MKYPSRSSLRPPATARALLHADLGVVVDLGQLVGRNQRRDVGVVHPRADRQRIRHRRQPVQRFVIDAVMNDKAGHGIAALTGIEEYPGPRLGDLAAGDDRAGENDLVDVRVAGQGRARLVPIAADQVHGAIGHADLLRQFGQDIARRGVQFGQLHHAGIARRQCRRQ